MKTREEIEKEYQRLLKEKDSQGVWDFFAYHPREITEEEVIKYHSELLKYSWHNCHDQLVSNFQWLSNPIAIEILYKTALNEEIESMDYKPIARKCTWALADIGTKESKEKLKILSNCGDEIIEGYANKRLINWEKEKYRKGLKQRFIKGGTYLYLDYYRDLETKISNAGKQIITAQQTEEDILVYQAFNNQIADYAITNQKFGGSNYSFNRMTWIKPNFLWMMYRSGWANKPNQERILAISLKKKFFYRLLLEGELSSINQSNYANESIWKKLLNRSEVRIQWDPHHKPDESRLERKAIQIGIKGSLQKEFGTNQINFIEDITQFVIEQRMYIEMKDYQYLKIPIETKMDIKDRRIIQKLSIED